MYFASIALLLAAFPALAIGIEIWLHPASDLLPLVGKWFTFFAVGARLSVAGIRQNLQPAFTANAIFQTNDPKSYAIVREVGFGNLAIGSTGLLALFFPN